MQKKMLENAFTLEDYLVQFESMKKMGGAQALLQMMPGMGGKVKAEDVDEKKIERTKAIIQSMTQRERIEPSIINSSRKKELPQAAARACRRLTSF